MTPAAIRAPWPALGWVTFVMVASAAVLIASGVPTAPALLLAIVLAALFAYRYPQATLALFIVLVPLLGITVSISTGELAFGRRAFGGSIDVTLVEIVGVVLLATWVMKVVWLWVRRHDLNWRPWMPMALPMAALVAAHLLSVLSPFHPDTIGVVKYALRPVLWSYLLFVLIPVNFIRSQRSLLMALGAVATMGVVSAVIGLLSLGVPDAGGGLFPRARPLPLFGLMPLGDNHNQLAEWLSISIPFSIAFLLLWPKAAEASVRMRRFIGLGIGVQVVALLFTFARTGWIVFAVEALLFGAFVWRHQLRVWARPLLIGLVCLLPLAAAMFAFSRSDVVAGSTSTRFMLSEISLTLWQASPWVGMGAGTFMESIGSTRLFLIEHGAPLDAHGVVQKLLAEVGLIGLAAATWLLVALFQFVRRIVRTLAAHDVVQRAFTSIAIGVCGILVYQLFSTNYWNGKMWLPIGMMLAAGRVFYRMARASTSRMPS